MHHRLASRLYFSVFMEAGRDRVFLVSEPRLSTCDPDLLLLFRKRDLVLTGNLKQVIVAL